MAYIGQGIKQGTFKVLDTSGNTYNGSNTTFSLGTQVGSAAQLLVSHDGVIQKPGTDYTLASGGTQITFSTAPASGASIFIVEISGAVGGTVTPSDNSVGITQLNVSDGSNGQALTTNGSGTLSFSTISTGLTGIDDQSSSNDDQLTITDTAVVINEDSDDVDFRVETNGNANMLFVSGGNDVVGIGAEGDLGVGLHVKSADAGGGSIDGNGNEIVVENDDHTGITMLVPNDKKGNIYFADPDASAPGVLRYDHNNNSMQFHVNASERMRLDNSGQLFLGVTSSSGFNGSTFKVPNGFSVYRNTSTGGNGVLLFYSDANSTGGNVGYYLANGGLANYQSNNVNLSDERLKKDIVDCPSTWDKIKSLKVRNFKYTEDKEERVVTGLIAQETETVDANLVNSVNGLYGYEEEQKDGKFKQIYTTDLYHQMLKALQEAQTRIETLETEMTALKARVTTLEE